MLASSSVDLELVGQSPGRESLEKFLAKEPDQCMLKMELDTGGQLPV